MLAQAIVAPPPKYALEETPIGMHMVRRLLLTAGIAAAIVAAGIAGTSAFATTTGLARPSAVSSPNAQAPGSFKSNEAPSHESGESTTREAAEASGKGFGPGACSNEVSAHETSESKAREAAEGTGA